MTQTCPNCGSPVQANHRFCSNCGTTLSPALKPSEPMVPETAETREMGGMTASQGEVTPAAPTEPSLAAPQVIPPATAYVVKTSEPEGADAALAPTVPMGTYNAPPSVPPPAYSPYVPPSPSGSSPIPPPGPESYQQGTGPRQEGFAYAPYSSVTSSALEKPKESRSFLMPVIIVAAVVLLALAVLSAYLVLQKPNRPATGGVAPSPVPTTAAESTKLPESATEEDKVKYIVRLSNDEQIKAWRDLDEEILKGTRIGQVLTEQIDMVQQLKQNNMYAIPENVELTFLSVVVKGDTATVRTREVWNVTFYRKADNKKIESRGPDTLTETYTLVKQDGKWLISKLEFDDMKTTPTPTPGRN